MKKHVRTILTVLLSICILLSCISVGFAAAPANENQQASREAFRVGIDSETKGHWQGKYGSDAAILCGYNYEGEITNESGWSHDAMPNSHDLIVKQEDSDFSQITLSLAGAYWCRAVDQSDETILDRPDSAKCKEKFFCGAFSGPVDNKRLVYNAKFQMELVNDAYHLITIYGSLDMGRTKSRWRL